jgi:phosphoglucomutase/phosphomannomutase
VVVANDVRVFRDLAGAYRFLGDQHPLVGLSSRRLAALACEIYAGNGIRAYIAAPGDDRATLSTPELSFSIAQLGAIGGINISASHNPPDDNGVKIYDEFGSQPVAPADQQLLDVMAEVRDVKAIPFEIARAEGLVEALPEGLHEEYLRGYVELYGAFAKPRADLPIVYSPLCGVGLDTVGDLLGRLGFPVETPPTEGPDGAFGPIPFRSPNPEVPQSTEPAREFAKSRGIGVVLSSDPDADRVGCEALLADGSWYHFDGNQIAAILAYALMLDPKGPRRAGLVIETLVTTKLVGQIARARGETDVIDDLLVGFKYVADVLKRLRTEGRYGEVRRRPEELVLACEESHGVIARPTILDKDAAPACMFLAGLYQRLGAEGRTLLDYYTGILEELGGYDTVNRSIMMAGPAGMERKRTIMKWLRETPPTSLAGHPVRRMADHWDTATFGPIVSESEWLPRDVVEITTERFVVAVRPSGTEPKLKFYCHLLPGETPRPERGAALLAALRAEADAAARAVYNDLLGPIGVRLGEEALLLTDLVELDRKQEFEVTIVPELHARLVSGAFATADEVQRWLRDRCAGLLPGADPLPALKAPLGALLARWRGELQGRPLYEPLVAWARGT